MTTGENIKRIRKEKGLTQKKLGELCGISESNIRKYENGKQNPKLETIQRIAKALEVSFYQLIDFESKDNKEIIFETFDYENLKEDELFLALFDLLGYHVKENKQNNRGGYVLNGSKDTIILSDDDFYQLKFDVKRYINFIINQYLKDM